MTVGSKTVEAAGKDVSNSLLSNEEILLSNRNSRWHSNIRVRLVDVSLNGWIVLNSPLRYGKYWTKSNTKWSFVASLIASWLELEFLSEYTVFAFQGEIRVLSSLRKSVIFEDSRRHFPIRDLIVVIYCHRLALEIGRISSLSNYRRR